jgi:PPOX class probable F420-dependent enzyme
MTSTAHTDRFVRGITLLLAAFMLVAGVWALLWPSSFADFAEFPEHEHFLHDLGAFQIAIGVVLVLALLWRDALAVALTGFLVGNTIHAVNHAVDLDLGGRDADPWLLAALSILTLVALVRRLRQLDWVVGNVSGNPTGAFARFATQKTVLVTTYRRDGTAVDTPVSIAVDAGEAFFRSYEKAGKTRRLRNNPVVSVAPSSMRGKPTGPPVEAEARRLSDTEDRHAARLLAAKYPLLQGLVVPLGHRLGRGRTGRTVHFALDAHPSSG